MAGRMAERAEGEVLRFAGVTLDLGRGSLRNAAGAEVPLAPKPFDLLRTLALEAGRTVSKDALLDARRAIGDEDGRVLRSVLRRGYMLDAVVNAVAPPLPEGVIEASDKPSLAVLVFDVISADPEARYFADGFREDLITALAKIDTLAVASRAPAPREQEFRNRYLIGGSVRTAGKHIRITAQLIDSSDGSHIWVERFDGLPDDVFAFQDSIVEQIVTALEVHLSDGAQVLGWRREAGDARAYQQFLSARSAYKEYSRAGNARARAGYAAALAITPGFVAALVGLARTHIEDATWGWSADQRASEGEALRLLDQAFALVPDHAMARSELAHLFMVQGRFDAAWEEALRAVESDPNLADPLHVLGIVLVCRGHDDEALRYLREALKLNRGVPEFYLIAMAEAHVGLRRFGAAAQILNQIVKRRPEWLMARALLAICLTGLGQREEAAAAVEAIRRFSPGFSAARWRRRLFYRDRSDVDGLEEMLIRAGLPHGT
jgi:TolB-like protein